ncbi:hypothetical protein GCM10027605_45070 [Micromonospora zhanjiangensis]
MLARLTYPFHNGGTEGVNTKNKLIKRQMYGRAGFALLRHRILTGVGCTTCCCTAVSWSDMPSLHGPSLSFPGFPDT